MTVEANGMVVPYRTENPDGVAVDMNASLLRQINAAFKQFGKFQGIMLDFYEEAVQHPDTVRRVR